MKNRNELIAQLKGDKSERCYQGQGDLVEAVFLFPGQGSQYTNMTIDLYKSNEAFRKDMDYCFDFVKSFSKIDFKEMIFAEDAALLNKTENTQISLFIVEYCLAKELVRSGIKPSAIIGHSLGEYVAACLVNCISLEDALILVYHRGRLMGAMPEGDMVLVRMNEEDLKPLLLDSVSICVFNAYEDLVIGGKKEDIEKQLSVFDNRKVEYKKLNVSHAYHTSMMEGALTEYEKILSSVEFKEFDTKVFSTYLGRQINSKEFCLPSYWLNQIMQPVRFLDAVKEVSSYISNPVFVEVGPGAGLSYFIKKIFNQKADTVNLLPKASKKNEVNHAFYEGIAILCAKGLVFDTPETSKGKRVPLPGYVFSKKYYWKPSLNIKYDDFNEINHSYHFNNEKYLRDRLKTSVEFKVNDEYEMSDEMFNKLNDLHIQYVDGIKKLLSAQNDDVQNNIEVFYTDISFVDEESGLSNNKDSNKNRKVSSVFVEPETENEKYLAKLWESVLGYQPVGVLDNYFEVGGNSLLATQLINKIIKDLEIELTVAEVLSNSNVKDLASLIDEKIWLRSDVEMSDELII